MNINLDSRFLERYGYLKNRKIRQLCQLLSTQLGWKYIMIITKHKDMILCLI